MSWPDPVAVAALASAVSRVQAAGSVTPVVLIDGPSGAGKSSLAGAIVRAWPGRDRPSLVRLDDMYPGWQGLEAASADLTEHLLRPRSTGDAGRWRRFDWEAGRLAEWHDVDPDRPLVVEGCGTLARANESVSDIRVWIDADPLIRRQRALARDGETFAVHWDEWQSQWEAWCEREQPEERATFRLFSR